MAAAAIQFPENATVNQAFWVLFASITALEIPSVMVTVTAMLPQNLVYVTLIILGLKIISAPSIVHLQNALGMVPVIQ